MRNFIMRILLLLLISFNCYSANWKIELFRQGKSIGQVRENSDDDFKKHLIRLTSSKFYKGEWFPYSGEFNLADPTYLVSRNDTNEDGNTFKYRFKPSNFTFIKTDITAQVLQDEQAAEQHKAEMVNVKNIDIDSLPVSPQLKEILKALIKRH